MALHFSEEELLSRRRRVIDDLNAQGFDGLLIFKQESMFYLTGYDSFGYCFFQALYLGCDGRFFLMTRAPDLRQAQNTSVIEDIRVWVDRDGHNPASELRQILSEYGVAKKRIGVEMQAYGLSAAHWVQLSSALAGFCTLTDASDVVNQRRMVKSDTEIAYVRTAAKLADEALDEAQELTHAGAFEGDILAAMQGRIFAGGGDYPANEFIVGSGDDALLCRYFTGRRHLSPVDQITLEFAGSYRRYHAALMRTLLVGQPHPEHVSMYAACADAMQACVETVKPGNTMGDVFLAHAKTLDAAGMQAHRLNACGYSLGATYTPTWMDGGMFFEGNSTVIETNMVLFIHIILMNSPANRAQTLGQTVRVTDNGCELLSERPLEMITG
ncbi:MAG: Xaa-Pro peptidase family protein [Burkholderiaceae bacterium]